ncbi:MAG: neutral/alkaline non-lysosomal ceramidase N-terminal domain-containing protein [Thermoguttaceae bacterium]
MSCMGRLACLVVCAAVVAGVRDARAAELRAGVARVNLTPPRELKASLGGYGARMSKPAAGVHDRVLAKALVLADGSSRFAVVTADVLALPPGFKDALAAALADAGWTSQQLLLLPSHSHTSIDMSALHPRNLLGIPQIGVFHKELYERTVARLAQVTEQAGRELVPVLVGTRSTRLEGWNRNRRRGNTATDPELTVTRIDRENGDPLAVLVNWTAHPTFMGPEDMMFSGDFPGHMQRTAEALIGGGVSVMYYNGAQGDQSPVARPDSGGNWEKAERYGRELGIQVWRQWQKITPQPGAILAFATETITLPARSPHPDFMKTGGTEYGLSEKLAGQMLALLFPSTTHSTSLRLGDLLIVGIPGEMTAELGMSVKSRVRGATGLAHVAIGGLADEWLSYILSPDEYHKGGYEASMSFYGATLGQVIADGAVRGALRVAPGPKREDPSQAAPKPSGRP